MIVKAKIAGFTFETTLDSFFQDNPGLECAKEWLKAELLRMGDCTFRYSESYATFVTLVLIKE